MSVTPPEPPGDVRPPPPPTPGLAVYRGLRLVLTVEGRPGVLLSTASPPPSGAPTHPFVSARASDPYSEGDLREILDSSASFEEFVLLLVEAGYDVVATAASPPPRLERAGRVRRGDQVVGFVAQVAGALLDIAHPRDVGPARSVATTTYEEEARGALVPATDGAGSFDAVVGRLATVGLTADVEGG